MTCCFRYLPSTPDGFPEIVIHGSLCLCLGISSSKCIATEEDAMLSKTLIELFVISNERTTTGTTTTRECECYWLLAISPVKFGECVCFFVFLLWDCVQSSKQRWIKWLICVRVESLVVVGVFFSVGCCGRRLGLVLESRTESNRGGGTPLIFVFRRIVVCGDSQRKTNSFGICDEQKKMKNREKQRYFF